MGTLSIYFSRSLAFDRLFERSNVEGLRGQLLPILTQMAGDYFPWGSGFGSFEHIYRIYEPQELLNPTYSCAQRLAAVSHRRWATSNYDLGGNGYLGDHAVYYSSPKLALF